jgi:enediyne biosynthesis protein E4
MTTPSGCIFDPVTTSVGLFPFSDLRVHFASGTESKAASIQVRWPSGTVQTVKDVAADQILKIEGPQK